MLLMFSSCLIKLKMIIRIVYTGMGSRDFTSSSAWLLWQGHGTPPTRHTGKHHRCKCQTIIIIKSPRGERSDDVNELLI